MESAKITLMHHTAKVPDGSYVDEPKVVKIAMLGLTLTDDNVDKYEKQLLFYRGRINEMRNREDENS